jgi:hypothetical protein
MYGQFFQAAESLPATSSSHPTLEPVPFQMEHPMKKTSVTHATALQISTDTTGQLLPMKTTTIVQPVTAMMQHFCRLRL